MTAFPGLPDEESARFEAARQAIETGNAEEQEKGKRLAAKEVFVAQMGIVYSLGEADEESETLREKLRKILESSRRF